jgi:hypothetical protein
VELEKDLSALEDSNGAEAERLAYRTLSKEDPAAALKEQEQNLNALMKQGQFCKNAKTIEQVAFRVLELAPYDKAAYHALLNASVVRQDLKMIFLMSKIGQRALYLSGIYDYAPVTTVDARFEFWQRQVFDPARQRAGTELVLDIVDCKLQHVTQSMPVSLTKFDLPVEVLRVLASRRVRVNLQELQGLDDARFLDRVQFLMEQVVNALRRQGQDDKPVTVALEQAPSIPQGTLLLDLSDVDLWGYPGETEFKLRRANGLWLTYHTDKDRRKQLLLPEGNYYLMVDNKVRKVFAIGAAASVPISLAAAR